MALNLTTPPAEAPVSRAEMKQWLKVDGDEDDLLVDRLIASAVAHLDGWAGILGRALVQQSWTLTIDRFPDCEIKLPLGALISVTSVKYDDPDGIEQTVASSDYEVDSASNPGWVIPVGSWPATIDTAGAVRVEFVAGYGGAAAVPEAIKLAIGFMVAHAYNGREGKDPVPPAAQALLAPYRMVGV